MGVARPLGKQTDASLLSKLLHDERRWANELAATVTELQSRLEDERQLRVEAEANARRFHALMLQARIRALPKRSS